MLGYLPQEFGVYPKMSALDMLQHLAVMKGITNKTERNQMVDALLNQTNLWSARKKALSTYSGGMKQRFGIAQALLANPKLIIVDEPTAGLDPAERNRFLNLLSSIGSNVTVILSTHIVEDVRELCPRMAIIANGELLLEGSPAETLEALKGKIWSKVVATDDELRALEANFTSSRPTWSAACTRFVSTPNRARGGFSAGRLRTRRRVLPQSRQTGEELQADESRWGDEPMAQFWEFFTFELKFRLKSVSTYVYFALWFFLSFLRCRRRLYQCRQRQDSAQRAVCDQHSLHPDAASSACIVMAAIFGTSILRDFQRDTYQISSPSRSRSSLISAAAGQVPSSPRFSASAA